MSYWRVPSQACISKESGTSIEAVVPIANGSARNFIEDLLRNLRAELLTGFGDDNDDHEEVEREKYLQ